MFIKAIKYEKYHDDNNYLFIHFCILFNFTRNCMSAYDKQIGGTHYKKMKIQPSRFVIENKLPFPEGNVIKYICRHPYKDGKQDLEKAKHFIDMIIERDYS